MVRNMLIELRIRMDDPNENFTETEAYSILYMQLATNDKAAAEFVNGVFPKDVVEAAKKQKEMAQKAGIHPVEMAKSVNADLPKVEGQQEIQSQVEPFKPIERDTHEVDVPMVEGQETLQ